MSSHRESFSDKERRGRTVLVAFTSFREDDCAMHSHAMPLVLNGRCIRYEEKQRGLTP